MKIYLHSYKDRRSEGDPEYTLIEKPTGEDLGDQDNEFKYYEMEAEPETVNHWLLVQACQASVQAAIHDAEKKQL